MGKITTYYKGDMLFESKLGEHSIQIDVPALVCINKADLHPAGTARIEAFCQAHGIEVVSHVPFDMSVSEAIVHGYPVTVFRPDCPASRALHTVWERVRTALGTEVATVPT